MIREVAGVTDVGVPVSARGVTPIGPLHRGPGELYYPVACGGVVVVQPGDVIVGDENGVAVVARDFFEEVVTSLEARKEGLDKYVADIRRGEFSNDWVDRTLAEKTEARGPDGRIEGRRLGQRFALLRAAPQLLFTSRARPS